MLFSNSPVKTISEKIKPSTGLEKGKVSRLKFDRKSDYKTFLNFIKDNTKKLDIEKSDKGDSKKQAVGIMGVALLASIFGRGGDKDKDGFLGKGSLLSKAIEKAKLDAEAEARKRKQGSGGSTLVSGLNTIQKFKTNIDTTYRNIGVGRKDYIFNRERRNKIVKSKERVKESAVSQERVYNRNRVKKRTLSTSNITVKQPVGAGAGAGSNKITPSERPQIFDNPVDRINAENLKKGKKLLNPNLAKQGFDPKSGMTDVGANVKKNFDAQSGRTTRPTPPISGQTPFDENLDLKKLMGMDIEPTRVNDRNFKNLSRLISGEIGSDDLDTLIKMDRVFSESDGKPIKMFDRRLSKLSLRDTYIFNPNTNRAGESRFTSLGNFFGRESFTAPSIPKGQPKLSGFDRFNRFSSRIFNSPAYKFGMFLGGLMANYKVEIIKQLLTPTSLADGTLQGAVNNKLLSPTLNFTDGGEVTNIFVPQEGVSSSIPLNFDGNANASKGLPSDLAAPPNNIFLDSDSSELQNLFFIKLAG